MDDAEIQRFMDGDVPESESRDVHESYLAEGECDWQTSFGTPAGSTYCGAPRLEGFRYCRFHVFHALNVGEDVDRLRS